MTYMFVGDSRMVGVGKMQGLTKGRHTQNSNGHDIVGQGKDGNFYYAAGGQSYNWFKANAGSIAQKAKSENCDYVVINMGVNDWPNFITEAGAKRMAGNYLALAKQIERQSGKKVVFVTPYPLHGEYAANRYNQQYDRSRTAINQGIQRFNKYIKQGANTNGFGFINIYDEVYKHIDDNSYWADGVHGSSKLNALIDKLWKEALAEMTVSNRSQTSERSASPTVVTEARAPTVRSENSGSSSTRYQGSNVVIKGSAGNANTTNTARTGDLTAKQRQNMESWARRVNLSTGVVDQLIKKYGANAYDLMLKAMMEPHYMTKYLGEGPRSSKSTIERLLNLEGDKANMLYDKYGLNGGVKKGTSFSTSDVSSTQVIPEVDTNNDEGVDENEGNSSLSVPVTVSNSSADHPVGTNYLSVIEKMPEYLVQFEGMKLKAYWDVNSPSIGLGTKQYWQGNDLPPKGKAIKTGANQTCTRAEAVLWSKQNLAHIYEKIKKAGLHVEKMTANQLIGVLSFAYNYGPGYLTSSKYGGPARIRAINAYLDDPTNVSKRDEVRRQMKATGSNRRRAFEAAMLLGDVACDDFGSVRQGCLRSISYTYQNGHYINVDANIEQYNSTNARKGTAYAKVWGSDPTPYYAAARINDSRA